MGRRPRPPLPTKPSPAAADPSPASFAFSATRIATAQIVQSIGFASANRSALDTLSDTAGNYLSALAAAAAASADSGGRTESNLHDVVAGLEALAASAQGGFAGASNLGRRILSSSTLMDLSRFVEYSLEIPFAQALRRHRPTPLPFAGRMHEGIGHVPSWLPEFPVIEREREAAREGERRLYGCLGGSEETRDDVREIERETVFVDERMAIGLPKKRERVRFEMGVRKGGFRVGSRNGVCRGGKRIFCAKITDDDDDDDETTRKKCNSSLNDDFATPLKYYRRRKRL